MLTWKTFAADSSEHSDPLAESIKKIKADYASHSAATPMGDSIHNFAAIPMDLVVRVSSFLDLKSCLSYLLTCEQVQSQSGLILVSQIPNMYGYRGLSYADVFFSFPHPQWIPDQLPTGVTLALHKWFFVGSKLKKTSTDPFRSFKLLYSAGCLGHKLAAHAAGEMLLNPDFNEAIPVAMKYEDLEPEVKQWDICRLNQPMTATPELQVIIEKMESLGAAMESSSSQEIEKLFVSLIQELSEFKKETDEKKAIGIFLEEALEHYQKHGSMGSFEPTKSINFVKGLGYTTPLLESFFQRVPEETDLQIVTKYKGPLNYDFLHNSLREYYESQIQKREAAKKFLEAERISILLGNKYEAYSLMPKWFFNFESDPEAINTAVGDHNKMHAPTNIFLCHLIWTRICSVPPTPVLKKNPKGANWYGLLANNMEHSNPSRLELIEEELFKFCETNQKQ